jgi:hypothetical protein
MIATRYPDLAELDAWRVPMTLSRRLARLEKHMPGLAPAPPVDLETRARARALNYMSLQFLEDYSLVLERIAAGAEESDLTLAELELLDQVWGYVDQARRELGVTPEAGA